MNGRDSNSNTALFLMELIVVICFFSLVAVICVRLFVAASVSSTKSVNVNHAVRTTESLAETWTVLDADLSELSALYPGSVVALEGESHRDGTLTIFYDADWHTVDESIWSGGENGFSVVVSARLVSAANCYAIEKAQDASAAVATISVLSAAEDEPILTLDVDHYLGERMQP